MQRRDGPAVAQPAHKNVRPCRFLTAGNLPDQWDLGRLFLRRKVASLQGKHVEVPRGVIDVESGIYQFHAVAIINLRPHDIGKMHLLTTKLREWQWQQALPRVCGIIADNSVSAVLRADPGIGDQIVRCPVAGPGRQRLDLRPGAVAKRAGPLQYLQQPRTKSGNLRVRQLDRAAAEMGRHTHPRPLELAWW